MGLGENVPENLLRKLQASTGTSQPGEKEGQSSPGIGSEADGANARRYAMVSLYVVKNFVSVSRRTT